MTKKKKRKYTTKKDVERAAKRMFGHITTYNMLRSLAVHSGRTVDQVAADGPSKAKRKEYFEAIAEVRDKKSAKEAAARKEYEKKARAEREARAAKLRKRPDLVRGKQTRAPIKVIVGDFGFTAT